MRLFRLAAVLAALCLAVPAAAQPHAPTLLREALDRMAANEARVRDYAFVMVDGDVRTPVYVHRADGEWTAAMPANRYADVLNLAVFWPGIRTPRQLAEAEHAVYLREETVDGRAVHLVSAELETAGMDVDSAIVTVDAETGHIVGILLATPLPEGFGEEVFGSGGRMLITLNAGGHRATEGLLLPGYVRTRMQLDLPNMPVSARRLLMQRIQAVRTQLRGTTDPDEMRTLALMENYARLLSPEGMDVRLVVEDVVINPGPPDWAKASAAERP